MLFIVSLVVLFNSYIYWNVNAENFLNARILFMLLLVKKIEDNFLTLKINVDLFAKKVSKSYKKVVFTICFGKVLVNKKVTAEK